jgi:hypothetical protein
MDNLYKLADLSRNANDADIRSALQRLDRSLAARVEGILLVPQRRRAYDRLLATQELHQELRRKLTQQHSGKSSADSTQSATHAAATPSGESSSDSSTIFRRIAIGVATTALIICIRYSPQIYREIFPQRNETYTSSYDYSSQEPPAQPPAEPVTSSTDQPVESAMVDSSMIEGEEEEPVEVTNQYQCSYLIYTYRCFATRFDANAYGNSYLTNRSVTIDWGSQNIYSFDYTPGVSSERQFCIKLDGTYESLTDCINHMEYLQRELDVDLRVACFIASDARGRSSLEFVHD